MERSRDARRGTMDASFNGGGMSRRRQQRTNTTSSSLRDSPGLLPSHIFRSQMKIITLFHFCVFDRVSFSSSFVFFFFLQRMTSVLWSCRKHPQGGCEIGRRKEIGRDLVVGVAVLRGGGLGRGLCMSAAGKIWRIRRRKV